MLLSGGTQDLGGGMYFDSFRSDALESLPNLAVRLASQFGSNNQGDAEWVVGWNSLTFVQMALQIQRKLFSNYFAFHSRYRYRSKLFWNSLS